MTTLSFNPHWPKCIQSQCHACRNLITLPSQLGGLGIINLARQAETQQQTSCEVTAPLIRHIIEQSKDFPLEAQEEQIQAKHAACQAKRQAQISEANNIQATLPSSLQKAVEIAKGNWGLYMAYRLTNHRAWIFLPQRRFSRCTLPSVWLETPITTIAMCM